MKPDLYTKTVLTVIAICLAVIALKEVDIIPKAHAAGEFKNNSRYGLVPLNADGTMDVNIRSCNTMIKVDVADINTSDKLNVNITDVNTYNKLPVIIKDVDSWAFNNCVVPVKTKQ